MRWIELTGAALGLAGCVVVASAASAQGFVREPEDEYLAIPKTPLYRAFLPPEKDLSPRFPTPGNQGQQGSCTAWAVGYALRSYYEGLRQGWDINDKTHQVSPASIYNRLNQDRGNCHTGTAISDALKLLKASGAVDLNNFPYSPNVCTQMPAVESQSSNLWRIADWRRVDMKRPDDIKGEIARENPVVFGMDVSKSLQELRSENIYDDTASERDGGHAMVIVGYSDSRQAFKVMNSWGTDWADDGFGWVSYRAVSMLSDRGFVMSVPPKPVEVPIAVVTPPPVPQPNIVPPPIVQPTPQPAPQPAPQPVVTPVTPVVAVDPPPLPPPPQPPAPPPPPNETPRERLTRTLAGLSCARVTVAPTSGPVTQLSGFVASAEDRAKLAAALGPQGERITDALTIHPWPQCEALITFEDAFSKPRGLAVQVQGGAPATLTAGSKLVVEVTTPDYPTYLYVTYLQASGDAVHLAQPTGLVPKALPPNTKVTLGAAPGGPTYRIGPPFGGEMIVAVASASPLFSGPRPPSEIERDYLTAFRLAFLEKPKPGVPPRIAGAAATTLTTRAP